MPTAHHEQPLDLSTNDQIPMTNGSFAIGHWCFVIESFFGLLLGVPFGHRRVELSPHRVGHEHFCPLTDDISGGGEHEQSRTRRGTRAFHSRAGKQALGDDNRKGQRTEHCSVGASHRAVAFPRGVNFAALVRFPQPLQFASAWCSRATQLSAVGVVSIERFIAALAKLLILKLAVVPAVDDL
jgi:hypothetical protein